MLLYKYRFFPLIFCIIKFKTHASGDISQHVDMTHITSSAMIFSHGHSVLRIMSAPSPISFGTLSSVLGRKH